MKFVNLDESEIIEQPLEKVIARPDYSPIEFGYDNLCSLDSVSVDGIHPSGGDSDLILPPSVNKINSCFKSEYFKISNLFSEIQTYEQKQEALKNLGLLDAINNSTYIHDLGRFDKQVDAEEEAVKVANNSNIIIMLYHIGSQNGIILQQVGDTITKQILLWDNTIFQRHVNFSDSSKTQVSSTSYWWKLGATHISYDPDTRKFHLQDMNYKNLNPTVDSKVPLASSTLDGFMSKELAQKLGTTVVKNDITNNLTTSSSTKVLSAQMGKTLKTEIDKLQLLAVKDLGTDLQPHIATGNIITYVKDNNIKETVLFKYIDTDGSSTLGVCISRINDIGWIIYLVARKGIERLVFNSNGVREELSEYGGVLRHSLDSVADEQLECLSVKGVKSLLSTKLDTLSPGDGITMMNNTVSTLIGNGLTYNGREIVIDHDLTLKTNNGKLGVNAGDGLYVNPDNELGINVGKGLTINHTDSTVEVAKEVLEEIDSKAPLEGYAPNLKVRFSDGLVGRIETIPHEIGRISPTAGISVDDNSATIERIKGESVVWNQLLNNNSLPKTGVYNDVEVTNNNNGTFTVNGTPLSAISTIAIDFGIQKCGHTYLFEGIPSKNAITETFSRIHYKHDGNNNLLKTVDATGNCFFSLSTTIDVQLVCYLYIRPNYTVTNKTYAPKLYDLTLMFGAGNEPTTIEEFEARKPLGVTNEYNEGTIVSFQGGDVKSVGFNAWDEEWEQGSFFQGSLIATNDYYRSKNPIKIVGGQNYSFTTPIKLYVEYFDENNSYLGQYIITNGEERTLPNNARFMWIRNYESNQVLNNICIHLVHSGYRNGEYEPYVDDIHPLPDIKSIKDSSGDTLFPYGLLSAGSVHDEITETKAIKRIGVVDMGSFEWTKRVIEESTDYLWQTTSLKGFIAENNSNNILSPIYPLNKANRISSLEFSSSGTNKTITAIFLSGSNYNYIISVKDTSYTHHTTFKQAMQGVLLYYELAEPLEVDLQEPLNMTYEAWDFGTEELVVSEPSTSLKGEIIYHFNAVDRIRENSRAIETLKEHVEELIDNRLDSNDIVNDLTTGGADKALSAEMGKVLGAELTELGSEATTAHKGLMSAEDKSRLAISNSFFIKEANTLQDAINTLVNIIPYDDKRSGVMVTYTDSNNVVRTYTFMSDTGFTNPTRWRSNVVNPYIESEQPVGQAYRLSDIIDYIKVTATGDIDTDAAYSFGYFGYFLSGKYAIQVKKDSEVLGDIDLDPTTLTGTLVTSNFIIKVKVNTLEYRHDGASGAFDYSRYYNRITPQLLRNAKLDWETRTLATDIEVLESKNTSNTNKVRHIEEAVFEVSKELVDVTYNGGYYYTTNGAYAEDAQRCCTDKIDVVPGEKYFVTVNIGGSGVIAYLAQWNGDAWVGIADDFKANSGNAVEREYVVPEGVTHIAVCSYNATPPTLTKSVVSDSTTFYTKDETYNRSEVDMLIASSPSGGSEADSNFINNVETITFNVEDNAITEVAVLGVGWSGNLTNGYTHISGNTETLEFNLPYASGEKFILEFKCDGVKGDSTDLLIAVGDTPTVKSYNGMSEFRIGFVANGGRLKITPASKFESTITDIAIRKISNNGNSTITINVGDVYSQANDMITAFWNIAIGSKNMTLSKLINGSRNVAIGRNTLNAAMSGNRNIAIGTFAMPFLTEAEENVAIGADTVYPLTKAFGCVGIGKATLSGTQKAEYCVAIGKQAMGTYSLAKDRTKCTAVGVSAGPSITDSCTHVGYRAGANVAGAKNTSIGYGSMAVGERTSVDITGEELTCIGYYSQIDNTEEAKNAKNSTAIGANTKITKSNQVVIGNANVEEVVIAGKKIIFNADGSVRWESI